MNLQAQKAGERADQLIAEMQQANSIPDESAKQGNTDHQQAAPSQSFDDDQAPKKPEHLDKSELEKLQQRFTVLEGKYRSEVPKLHSIIRDQKQQIQTLQSKLSDQNEGSGEYFKEFSEEFGEETAQKLQSGIDKLLADKIPAQSSNQNQSVDQADQHKEQYVIDIVGGAEAFQRIDTNPEFNAWLDKYDTNTGKQRRQMLVENFQAGRLNETADMYLQWASRQQQPEANQQKQSSGTNNILEEQVQPGSVKASQTQSGKKTYTMSEYKAILTDLSRNQWYRNSQAGRDKAAAIQNELDAAFMDGRIINDIAQEPVTDPYKMNG